MSNFQTIPVPQYNLHDHVSRKTNLIWESNEPGSNSVQQFSWFTQDFLKIYLKEFIPFIPTVQPFYSSIALLATQKDRFSGSTPEVSARWSLNMKGLVDSAGTSSCKEKLVLYPAELLQQKRKKGYNSNRKKETSEFLFAR